MDNVSPDALVAHMGYMTLADLVAGIEPPFREPYIVHITVGGVESGPVTKEGDLGCSCHQSYPR